MQVVDEFLRRMTVTISNYAIYQVHMCSSNLDYRLPLAGEKRRAVHTDF